MTEQRASFKVSRDYEVVRPGTEKAYMVPISEWDNLRKKVDRMESGGSMFHTIGAVLLGIAGTALVGALTLPEAAVQSGVPTRLSCWALFAVTLICGLLSLCFVWRQRKTLANSKEDFLSEMDRIKECLGGGGGEAGE